MVIAGAASRKRGPSHTSRIGAASTSSVVTRGTTSAAT